jgi:hypothetical protein
VAAEIIYDGQEYWKIVTRVNRHRENSNIRPIAIFEMRRLGVRSEAVRRRVQSFIAKHQSAPPSNSPKGGGGAAA